MSTITKDKKLSDMTVGELQEIIRDAIKEEILKTQINQIPYVSDEEMEKLEAIFTDEDFSDKGEFVDGTEWLGR